MKAIRWNGEAADGAVRSLSDIESQMSSALSTAKKLRLRLANMQSGQGSPALTRMTDRLEREIRRIEGALEEAARLRRGLVRASMLFEEAEAANVRKAQGFESRPAASFAGGRGSFGGVPGRRETERALGALAAVLGGGPGARSSGEGLGGGFSGGGGSSRSFSAADGAWYDAPGGIAGIASLEGVEWVGAAPLATATGEVFLPSWLL